GVTAVGLAAIVLGSAWIAARPQQAKATTERLQQRDIVLCLDVSNSMLSLDGDMARKFNELADQLKGVRIGIALFNEVTSTVLPLTDDQSAVTAELDLIEKATNGQYGSDTSNATGLLAQLLAPTISSGTAGSLIGDGVASCSMLFDGQSSARSRTMVLATDNEPDGQVVLDLPQATQVLKAKKITLDGLYSPPNYMFQSGIDPATAKAEFQQCATSTGGLFTTLSDSGSVSQFVQAITSASSGDVRVTHAVRVSDRSGLAPLAVLLGALLLAVGVWRTKA
ncbi:MAG: VWA domain-containing protein, partial [Bifidobacteriaceae bacterium]|nr:VWA domain-containing protein [Bifidobacteriaceae bacterium]